MNNSVTDMGKIFNYFKNLHKCQQINNFNYLKYFVKLPE